MKANNSLFSLQYAARKPSGFTLIELPVVTSQHCRHFFKRFVCTDKYGCVRKHTESAAHKNTSHHTCKASASCTAHNSCFASAKTCSLFLKGEWGLGKGENLFSREKKFFLLPRKPFHFNRTAGCYRHYCDPGGDFAADFAECPGAGQKFVMYCQFEKCGICKPFICRCV